MLDENILLQWEREACYMAIYPNPMFPPSYYYRFLRILARELRPKLSVELGVCGGGGSLHLALGHPEGQVVGVDGAWDHPDHIATIKEVCPNFEFWRGDSVESAKPIYDKYGPVGILFIDTTHENDQTAREFNAWRPFLADEAVLVLDDLFRPGMHQAWEKIPGQRLRMDLLHIGGSPSDGGFGVIWDVPKSP